MKVLRFQRSYPPYNMGETAGFDDEEADRLLAMNGVATLEKGMVGKAAVRSPEQDPPGPPGVKKA